MTQAKSHDAMFCEICESDPPTPACRACVDCQVLYCAACHEMYHPMTGKMGKHTTVTIDERRQRDMQINDSSMYCNGCDVLVAVTDISSHKSHDVISLKEAHMVFKIKLDQATGDVGLMESTLKSCMTKSKEKLKLVESTFKEAELDLARKNEEVLSKIRYDTKEAKASTDDLLPTISAYKELQTRADTISFIEDCKDILLRSTLSRDFDEVCKMFGRIEQSICSTKAVKREICNLACIQEADVPRITKLSHAIIQHKTNQVLLEWTAVQNADSYNVFYKVKGATFQSTPTSDTSCVLENIDGNDTTVLWITAIKDGKEGIPSASVTVPIVTLLGLQFNIKKAGDLVRVSIDGKKISLAKYAAELIGDHHPASPVGLHHPWSVTTDQLAMAGRLHWEIEAMHTANEHCLCTFGVMVTSSPGNNYPGADAESWGVELRCDTINTTIVMKHAGIRLYEEVVLCVRGSHTHRYGQLLDFVNGSLSVFDADNNKSIYTFKNVDTPKGITPVFSVYNSSILRLAEPAKINGAPMLPFPMVQQ